MHLPPKISDIWDGGPPVHFSVNIKFWNFQAGRDIEFHMMSSCGTLSPYDE